MKTKCHRLGVLSIAFVVSIGATQAAGAAVFAGPVVNPATGHSYYLLTESPWQTSEAEALTLGGHLATINDASEQNWVFSTFGNLGGVDRSLWIGLNDALQEGNFVWTSGETTAYSNWIPGQPDNFGGAENYVHMMRAGLGYTPGTWNDLNSPNIYFPSFGPIQGVVEVVPEPSTLLMLGLGIFGALVARRRRSS